jgi:hypothetical protein
MGKKLQQQKHFALQTQKSKSNIGNDQDIFATCNHNIMQKLTLLECKSLNQNYEFIC